jgi:hypothetical protein
MFLAALLGWMGVRAIKRRAGGPIVP